MVTVLRTGSDKLGQVWTSQNRCEALFFLNHESHAVQIWPTLQTCVQFSNRTSLETLRPSEVVETALRHASNWRKVWTGVKCNFSWVHFQNWYIITKLSLSRVRRWNFTRKGLKTKKLWLLIIPALRRSYQPRLGKAKTVWTTTFLGRTWTSHTLFKSSQSRSLSMQFRHDWPKDKNTALLIFLPEN